MALSGLSVWIDATLRSGATTRPKIGPFVVSLGSGRERRKTVNLRIPGRLRAGLYEIHLRAAGPVCDRATLPVIKLP
jgi:hypothetical protein